MSKGVIYLATGTSLHLAVDTDPLGVVFDVVRVAAISQARVLPDGCWCHTGKVGPVLWRLLAGSISKQECRCVCV